MTNKNLIWAVGGLIILALVVAGYFYFKKPVEKEGAVGAAEQASEAVPEILTNPGEKAPEINPLDRANPFKYENPLR